MKRLLIGSLVALAITLGLAPTASADYYSANERQYLSTLYANGMVPSQTTNDLLTQGYWVCDILGNHSGGYVASQVWLGSHANPDGGIGISYSQANTVVYAAIANLCPWRWY